MASRTPQNSNQNDEGEEWEVISTPKAHEVDHKSGNNNYVQFQVDSWLGRLSYLARISNTGQHNEPCSMTQTQTSIVHQQEQSLLFELPAEIRLYIYELVFHIPMTGHGIRLRRSSGHDHSPSVLASLLACRRFKNEAEHMFYSINRIFIDEISMLDSPGKRRRDGLTMGAIATSSASSMLQTLMNILQQLPNLKSLHVVRRTSVKFIDPRSWAVMAPQIITEIKKMKALKEIKFITPDPKGFNEDDMARKRRLDEIDEDICSAASASPWQEAGQRNVKSFSVHGPGDHNAS